MLLISTATILILWLSLVLFFYPDGFGVARLRRSATGKSKARTADRQANAQQANAGCRAGRGRAAPRKINY